MIASALNFTNRKSIFQTLDTTSFDLVIIGAGITGCGIARDAAMRGLSVALVDANDIAAGTSSRSSKLIHGGMRYLAAGQIGVVKEAATERKTLRRIAPHLAQTTRMLVPAKSKASILKFKTAMVAYEKLGEVAADERHTVWSLDELQEREPELISDQLAGAVVYPEYVTDDARLTLGNARSAAEAGAVIATYAKATRVLTDNGKAVAIEVQSTLPNEALKAVVKGKAIINASGPWLDHVCTLEDSEAKSKLQLTKGIHVTLSAKRLPINTTVIMQTPDKRSIFVVPRGKFVYFGTTDTFYPDTEYWPEITREDVDYLLDIGSKTFKCGPFDYDDIQSMWSGVRPLMAQAGKNPSEISRKNEILRGPTGIISIAGGKLTSYRSMAERIVDQCVEEHDLTSNPCATAEMPLPGGTIDGDFFSVILQLSLNGVNVFDADRALRLYGNEAPAVFENGPGIDAEIQYAVTHEGALTLEDYWVRRSARARFDTNGGVEHLDAAARAMGPLLGWNNLEILNQIDHCKEIRRREMQAIQLQE
jgi:glycerol-3-phosphate dehydrogenase